MQEEIMLREMRDEDYEAIEEIISETWNYDQLTTPQAARKMAKAYLYGCLANQTYKQVAICDKTVAGVIMGKNIRHCLLYTSPSPRDKRQSRMPSSA